MNDDDVNAQFAFDPDSDDLLIWFDRPMKEMRLRRVDALALYTLLGARLEDVSGTSRQPAIATIFLSHAINDHGMIAAYRRSLEICNEF